MNRTQTEIVAAALDKTVESVELYEGELLITFQDSKLILQAIPEGDCCAVTNIVEITGDFEPAPLVSVETTKYKSKDVRYGVMDTFVEVITIGAKEVAVLCQCEHNGYYGGWLDWRVVK